MIGPGEGARGSGGARTGLRARRGRGDGRLEALLDLVASGVALLDAYGRIIAWNSAAEAMLRWRLEDVAGLDVVEAIVAPGHREAAHDILARVRTEGAWEGRVPLLRRDGGTIRCTVRARALDADDSALDTRMPAGEVVAVFAEVPTDEGAAEAGATTGDDRAALLRAERAARSELEYVRDRLAYVVHASSRLASSLDVGMTLETVGFLVVPRFGQLCIIDLWDGRRLDRVFVHDAAAGSDPARQALVEEIRKLGGLQRDDHPGIRAVLSGRPAVVTTTSSDVAATMYDDPSSRSVVEQATQGQGFMSVPLITRGRVIGVLTLLGPGRAYGRALAPGEDLPVLEQVANRAAQSIENARLFDAERRLARSLQESERRQRRAALTLQRSLLPAWTHQPAELEVATRYFPGAEEAEVGGDWYDVMPVGTGRTALVIGDVMGRGLRAATLMGQVRTAVRAYARQDLAPKEILDLLDGVVADLGEAEIVTCVYAVFDRMRGTLTYASAGHLPLLVVDRRNRARRLDHESGLPLGVGRCAAPEHVVQV
ncbi:MAG TPA: SpoIIE family protein phosphatase, partial [Actinopolymorphaceae bacterium]|nr:SpoIIE family protein phosphatase [Actinopolymorphaceae bacterium]